MLPVVILAGGLATRMHPHTKTLPKALLSIHGQPFIEHQLCLLAEKGIQDIVLCLGHLGEQVIEYVEKKNKYGLNIQWSMDGPHLLGTGGAIYNALPLLSEQFMVLYGDSYLDIDYKVIADAYQKSSQPALLTIYKNNNQFDTSNIQYENGCIIDYNKTHKTDKMQYIDYGLSCLHKKIFTDWKNTTFDLSDVYTFLVKNRAIVGYEVTQRFYEIGSPHGLAALETYLSQKTCFIQDNDHNSIL